MSSHRTIFNKKRIPHRPFEIDKPVDSTNRYHQLAYSEKTNYLSFIYGLGKAGLASLFRFPGEENLSLWHLSVVAEKATMKSDAYANLIGKLAGEDDGITQDIADKNTSDRMVLLQFFFGFYTIIHYAIKSLYARLLLTNYRNRRNSLNQADYTIVSYFPHLDKRKAAEGQFENQYLAPYHRALAKRRQGKYCHVCLPVHIDGYNFQDAIKLAKGLSDDQTILLLEEFFRIKHILLMFIYYIYFAILFILHINDIKHLMVYTHHDQKYNVWPLFKRDLYKSFCGTNLASSLWYIFVLREMTACLKQNSKVISICEMQWWEQALYYYTNKYKLISIGYQHTIAPELMLNYYHSFEEVEVKSSAIDKCSVPDYIATVGKTTATNFHRYGWPEKRIIVWGAQRFSSLREGNLSKKVPWNSRDNYFVCAFSISPKDAENILILLEKAFYNSSAGYKIYLKSHPSLNIKRIIDKLNIKLNTEIISVKEEPLPIILKNAKGLIVTESSSSFYGLINNIPIIVPRFKDTIDCNPLSYISDLPAYVNSPNNLRHICNNIIKAERSPLDGKMAEQLLNDYFYYPSNDDEYLAKIDSLTPIPHE